MPIELVKVFWFEDDVITGAAVTEGISIKQDLDIIF